MEYRQPFKFPFKVKNIKPASFGMRSVKGEVAVAELVDATGRFVAAGGFEDLMLKASDRGWPIDNETEGRCFLRKFGSVV